MDVMHVAGIESAWFVTTLRGPSLSNGIAEAIVTRGWAESSPGIPLPQGLRGDANTTAGFKETRFTL